MVKKSLIWLYAFTTYLLWFVIIVLACGILGMRYFVLPRVQDYRTDITSIASETIGQKITIGKLDAGWDGLNPHFDLRQVTIYDPQQRPALQFDHIEASLSWLSLAVLEPRLDNLTIHEPRLTVRRETDGTIFVAGMSISGPSRPAFPNWLLRQQEIVVRDAAVIWQDDMRQAPQLALEKLNLVMERPFSRSLMNYHRFGLTAIPSAGASRPLDIRGSVYGGDVSRTQEWHGTLYAATEGTEISAWRTWLPLPDSFHRGFGAMRVWADFSGGAMQSVSTDIALRDVTTQINVGQPPLTFLQVTAHLSWNRRDNGGFMLTANKLHLESSQGFKIANGTAKWVGNGSGQSANGELSVEQLALEPLAALASYLPIGEDNQKKLSAMLPGGLLNNLRLSWQNRGDHLEKYNIKTGFDKLALSPCQTLPGFSGLSGNIEASQDGGKLSINSKNFALNMPEILRTPFQADTLSTQAEWSRSSTGTEIKIRQLDFANPHMHGVFNALYRTGEKGGFIDLTGDVRDMDARFAHLYYPKIMGKNTLHWLDTSIFGGRSDDVKVRIKGHANDFPYTGGKTGEFSVTASIRDALVDYASEWPKMEGLKMKMKFYENKMLITEGSGRVMGIQFANTTARINDILADDPVLEVEGQGQGSVMESLRFIERTPIRQAINGFTDGMRGNGTGKLGLKLVIPLNDTDSTRINGNYTLGAGSLEGNGDFPALDRINGRLEFTESAIKGNKIQAMLFGSPVTFSIASGANKRVDISARGKLTHTALQQAVHHPLADYLYGSAEWQGQMTLQDRRSDISVDFPDLVGMSSSLPYPLDKASDTRMPLRIERKLTSDGDVLTLNYGSADRAISLRQQRLQRGDDMIVDRSDLRLGGESHPQTLARGFNIGGTIAHLDADQWQAILRESSPSKARQDAMPAIQSAHLKLGWVDVFGKRLNDLRLDMKSDGVNWKSDIQSREINGEVTWLPKGHGHVIAKLDSLTIPESAPPKLSEGDTESKPLDYPSISLTANQFETRGKKLGKLELRAKQQGNHWDIEALRLENPEFVVDASGSWQNWRGRANTVLNITMDVTDVGKGLERFGYPDAVKGSSALLKGSLSWPGGPQAYAAEKLSGNFSLNVTKGQFLKIRPGGVGRLLGLLSLQNLPRRLLLDFRDIFSSGFAFDRIAGDVRISQGVMTSDNFVMEGASAKVAISGETDLARETQNLRVKVTPALSDSLSLAALAGGPAVAVGAFIAQKLLNDPLNKIASYEYNIVGTWDNPQEVKKDSPQAAPTPSPLGK